MLQTDILMLTPREAHPVLPPADGPVPDAVVDQALCRVQEGDTEAFAVVVMRYTRPLLAWLATRCPATVDPEEIVHTTLITAFRSIAIYRPGSNPTAWIWAIARAQLAGALTAAARHEGRARRHAPALLGELLARTENESPDDTRLDRLELCLERLGTAARDLLDRRYTRDQGLEDMARELGRSVGALKKSLFLLREKLHACLMQGTTSHG